MGRGSEELLPELSLHLVAMHNPTRQRAAHKTALKWPCRSLATPAFGINERAIAGEPPRRRSRFAGSVRSLQRQANQILPQEVEGHSEQNDVLHKEGNVARHRREASRGDVPALRHERNDRDGRDEGAGRTEGAKNAEPLVPEAREQQGPERPLRDAQEIAGAGMAEQRIQPPDQRPVADEGDQSFELVRKPLLVAEE